MSEYVKELLKLSKDIEKMTTETIKSVKPTKFQLLDEAVKKINSHYDSLLDSIDGEYFRIKLNLEDDKYELVLFSNYSIYTNYTDKEKSRYAYIEKTNYSSETSYVLNENIYGICKVKHDKGQRLGSCYVQPLKDKDNKYYVKIIELVTKFHDEIQEEIKKYIEEAVTKRNLENSKKASDEAELINTLNNFLN